MEGAVVVHGDLGADSEKMRHAVEDRGVWDVGLARLVGASRLDEILKGHFYRAAVVESNHVSEGVVTGEPIGEVGGRGDIRREDERDVLYGTPKGRLVTAVDGHSLQLKRSS